MHSLIKIILALTIVFGTAACGSSSESSSSVNSNNSEENSIEISKGELSTSKLRELLISKYEDETSLMFVVPFFIDAESIEVVSDPEYRNLEVNATAYMDASDSNEINYGKVFRYPRENVGGGSPNLAGGDYICAKDVMQKFSRDILWQMQYEGNLLPLESLKITVRFYVVTGSVTEDEFGNQDDSNLQEKDLVKALIHISRSNLDRITDAYGPDDYYALSDLTKPTRHLSKWNQCRSWTS